MTIRFAWSSMCAMLLAAACGGGPTEASFSPLTPLTPLEAAIKRHYQAYFNEAILYPAIFSSIGCSAAHVTTTAYLRKSGKVSDLLTLYTSSDGETVTLNSRSNVLTPAGTLRALVVLLRYSVTLANDAQVLWEHAQSQINEDHAAFARARGYAAPIVLFDNTNVILDASQVADPRTLGGVTTALALQGTSVVGYDIVVAVNIDPSRSEGGEAAPGLGPAFIYMGNYGRWNAPLTSDNFTGIAGAVYHHEVIHLWGWPGTHDWASCPSANSPFGFNFRVPPVLLGWEDLDGDGIPEILDPTPYGRPGP